MGLDKNEAISRVAWIARHQVQEYFELRVGTRVPNDMEPQVQDLHLRVDFYYPDGEWEDCFIAIGDEVLGFLKELQHELRNP